MLRWGSFEFRVSSREVAQSRVAPEGAPRSAEPKAELTWGSSLAAKSFEFQVAQSRVAQSRTPARSQGVSS